MVVVVTFKFKLTEEVCMVSRFGSPINKSSSMTSKLVFKLDSSTFPYGIKWKVKVSDIQSQNLDEEILQTDLPTAAGTWHLAPGTWHPYPFF